MGPRSTALAKFSSVFLRLALGISFLSAVTDRFGLWGDYGQPNVSWGHYARFVTAAEAILGLLLVFGWKTRTAALLSGLLLISFALTMTLALGVKAPLNLSVFSVAGGALFLGACETFPLSLDEFLQRNRQGK